MKKAAIVICAAAALALIGGSAGAGDVGLYAYNAKGKLTKAGKFGTNTRVYREDELKKMKAGTRKQFGTKIEACQGTYFGRPVQNQWLAAHQKMKHKVVLRERVAKGKFKAICTL